ncbi:hypothetical protein [Pantoea sp. S18]|uniref:hypothetical protein n=1 Tax=Pantoea sp. S18 TaxID=3019892 RepID=UPI002B1EC8C6|nr:hypothetical protein [Pantoea sp. S18]MEA5105636.1 hypothetical protein [Pantoea sp. S18]
MAKALSSGRTVDGDNYYLLHVKVVCNKGLDESTYLQLIFNIKINKHRQDETSLREFWESIGAIPLQNSRTVVRHTPSLITLPTLSTLAATAPLTALPDFGWTLARLSAQQDHPPHVVIRTARQRRGKSANRVVPLSDPAYVDEMRTLFPCTRKELEADTEIGERCALPVWTVSDRTVRNWLTQLWTAQRIVVFGSAPRCIG